MIKSGPFSYDCVHFTIFNTRYTVCTHHTKQTSHYWCNIYFSISRFCFVWVVLSVFKSDQQAPFDVTKILQSTTIWLNLTSIIIHEDAWHAQVAITNSKWHSIWVLHSVMNFLYQLTALKCSLVRRLDCDADEHRSHNKYHNTTDAILWMDLRLLLVLNAQASSWVLFLWCLLVTVVPFNKLSKRETEEGRREQCHSGFHTAQGFTPWQTFYYMKSLIAAASGFFVCWERGVDKKCNLRTILKWQHVETYCVGSSRGTEYCNI